MSAQSRPDTQKIFDLKQEQSSHAFISQSNRTTSSANDRSTRHVYLLDLNLIWDIAIFRLTVVRSSYPIVPKSALPQEMSSAFSEQNPINFNLTNLWSVGYNGECNGPENKKLFMDYVHGLCQSASPSVVAKIDAKLARTGPPVYVDLFKPTYRTIIFGGISSSWENKLKRDVYMSTWYGRSGAPVFALGSDRKIHIVGLVQGSEIISDVCSMTTFTAETIEWVKNTMA